MQEATSPTTTVLCQAERDIGVQPSIPMDPGAHQGVPGSKCDTVHKKAGFREKTTIPGLYCRIHHTYAGYKIAPHALIFSYTGRNLIPIWPKTSSS